MPDEAERLRTLAAYDVLDTPPEAAFDRLTALAADLFDTPIALVSLIDAERQWFKSRHGLAAPSTPRSQAFCAHAIELGADTTFVVEDATRDPRFAANPLVTGDPNIRFYAGAVLTGSDGFNLGTLCVIDTVARPAPTEKDLQRLQTLARVVVGELELRRLRKVEAERARFERLANEVAGVGYWRLDAGSRKITWSDQVFAIYGLEVGDEPPLDAAMARSHPDDQAASAERVLAALQTGVGWTDALTRIVRPNGELRYVEGRGICERGADGTVSAILGTLVDITDRKRAELAHLESELRFRRLADNAPDMIAESNLEGIMTYVSPACLAITGFTQAELVGRTSVSLTHPDDAHKVPEMCRAVFDSKGALAPWPIEFRATHKAGHEIWLECKPTLAIDAETGRFTGLNDVIRDITARKRMEAELRQARADAEKAAAVKGEFLANMSHELRTPLTSILGFTRLAAEQAELGDLTRGYLNRVGAASNALLCTVNDILDFSKLEAGQLSFHPAPTDFASLARETLDLLTPQAAAKDLDLVFDCAAEQPVSVDPDRLRQVLLNLVGNAVKFSVAGSVTLSIRYDSAGEALHVEVIDTGVGIEPRKLGLLFQRFSQIDGSLTRAHNGTGLGLAICKGLIEAMGGQIGVTSQVGVGSRFWFSVPAPPAAAPAAAANGQADLPSLAGVRVLVADDHPANRELARLVLAGLGAELTEAADGEIAADLVATWPFDVILMDIRMPRLDGPGALRKIRASAGPNDSTPILAFTADAEEHAARDFAGLGFQGVVGKPLEPDALVRAIARSVFGSPVEVGEADAA